MRTERRHWAVVAAIALAIVSIPVLVILVAIELHGDGSVDTYWEANGPEYHVIDRGAYNAAIRAGICRAASHVRSWPDAHETQHVCEL